MTVELENSYSEYLAKLPRFPHRCSHRNGTTSSSREPPKLVRRMISPFNPDSYLVRVSSIEDRLRAEKCTKVTYGTKHTCLWRAPNGRHFHAPNPNVYSMVPSDTLDKALQRLALVMRLPPV